MGQRWRIGWARVKEEYNFLSWRIGEIVKGECIMIGYCVNFRLMVGLFRRMTKVMICLIMEIMRMMFPTNLLDECKFNSTTGGCVFLKAVEAKPQYGNDDSLMWERFGELGYGYPSLSWRTGKGSLMMTALGRDLLVWLSDCPSSGRPHKCHVFISLS